MKSLGKPDRSESKPQKSFEAVIEEMKASEQSWAKESSKAPGLSEAQKNHPSAQSKKHTSKETDS